MKWLCCTLVAVMLLFCVPVAEAGVGIGLVVAPRSRVVTRSRIVTPRARFVAPRVVAAPVVSQRFVAPHVSVGQLRRNQLIQQQLLLQQQAAFGLGFNASAFSLGLGSGCGF